MTDSESDSESMYFHSVQVGDVYNSRYVIEQHLGNGRFSSVWLASDRRFPPKHHRKMVAIKFSRSDQSVSAEEEIEAYNLIQKNGATPFILHQYDNFEYHGPKYVHIVQVFEPMVSNAHTMFVEEYDPYPETVRDITFQLIKALSKLEEVDVLHLDIKPDNILISHPWRLNSQKFKQKRKYDKYMRDYIKFTSPDATKGMTKNQRRRFKEKKAKFETGDMGLPDTGSEMLTYLEEEETEAFCVKLSDFGLCRLPGHKLQRVVITQHYRPPEIIMGLPYSHTADVWATACSLWRIVTGESLFEVSSGNELQKMLKRMTQIRGKIPPHMKKACKRLNNGSKYPKMTKMTPINLLDEFKQYVDEEQWPHDECTKFVDFILYLLELDPAKRPTASIALAHPYINDINETFEKEDESIFEYPMDMIKRDDSDSESYDSSVEFEDVEVDPDDDQPIDFDDLLGDSD